MKSGFSAYPYLLGFEGLDQMLERTAKQGADGYPPYNIEVLEGNRYRITLAVAGFSEEEISIHVEGHELLIAGHPSDDTSERAYLHRGIAGRQFRRGFVLAQGVEVEGARLENGLLHIDLFRKAPETSRQSIKIRTR